MSNIKARTGINRMQFWFLKRFAQAPKIRDVYNIGYIVSKINVD